MKRAKIEDDHLKAEEATEETEAEETVTRTPETLTEFTAASHDRCSDNLVITAYNWVQRSHLLHVGSPIIVVQPGEYEGRRGAIVRTHPGLMYSCRLWALPDGPAERLALHILHRNNIKRAGLSTNSVLVPPNAGGIETLRAGNAFVTEASREIARLNHGNQPGVGGEANRDCDGERLYVGDIVVIRDKKEYDGWNGQVQRSGPGSVTIMIGMPPGYNCMEPVEYENLRRTRALAEQYEIEPRLCKLMNFNK